MATAVGRSSSVNMYWNMVKNLDADLKLDLIDLLVKSLPLEKKVKADEMLRNIYGSWDDERSAEEIIADIRGARTFNRDIEL